MTFRRLFCRVFPQAGANGGVPGFTTSGFGSRTSGAGVGGGFSGGHTSGIFGGLSGRGDCVSGRSSGCTSPSAGFGVVADLWVIGPPSWTRAAIAGLAVSRGHLACLKSGSPHSVLEPAARSSKRHRPAVLHGRASGGSKPWQSSMRHQAQEWRSFSPGPSFMRRLRNQLISGVAETPWAPIETATVASVARASSCIHCA